MLMCELEGTVVVAGEVVVVAGRTDVVVVVGCTEVEVVALTEVVVVG